MYMSIQQMRVNVLPATILPISEIFFTDSYGDDKVYSVVGFGPGFDASYVVLAFQNTTNAILTELNNVRRRRLGEVTFIPPSSGKGKGGKGGSGTSSGKGSSGKGSSGKGGKGGSGAGFIRPEYTVDELVASLGSPGNYAVSPEVTETLLYLSNTESADFIAALSGSSDAITSIITNVVRAVKTLVNNIFSGTSIPAEVATRVECLECLGSLFVNIAKPDPNVTCSTTCQL